MADCSKRITDLTLGEAAECLGVIFGEIGEGLADDLERLVAFIASTTIGDVIGGIVALLILYALIYSLLYGFLLLALFVRMRGRIEVAADAPGNRSPGQVWLGGYLIAAGGVGALMLMDEPSSISYFFLGFCA